jgi:hypothetical protein
MRGYADVQMKNCLKFICISAYLHIKTSSYFCLNQTCIGEPEKSKFSLSLFSTNL